jgi:protein ImuB
MPLVLVGQTGRRREVTAANTAAIKLGLRIGMPATKAQALVKELVIHHADPEADAEALERLAVWALRYSPVVAADDPDGLVIDTTGASHLHGGEDAMLAA